jgi:hypothetical protein
MSLHLPDDMNEHAMIAFFCASPGNKFDRSSSEQERDWEFEWYGILPPIPL